jgi:hypothetical protein
MLRARRSIPCWSIVFSTFRRCMSFSHRLGHNLPPSFSARMSPSAECGQCHVRRAAPPQEESKRDRPGGLQMCPPRWKGDQPRAVGRCWSTGHLPTGPAQLPHRPRRPARRFADPPAYACDDDAKSAFASCRHAAALALAAIVPLPGLMQCRRTSLGRPDVKDLMGLPERAVALTRILFERRAIHDLDETSPAPDQALALQ